MPNTLGITEFNLAEALLFCSEYQGSHTIFDIDKEDLQKLSEQFWEWHEHAGELCEEDEALEDLCLYERRTLEHDYVYSRLHAGTGLWDNYRKGKQLDKLASMQGSLEGLIDNGETLLII